MIYTKKMQEAIAFMIDVHEQPKQQKRKGKEVPYCTHPLTVGLILAQAGADEAVVTAGILHDTIEDCEPYGSVTRETIATRFGEEVAELVNAVTEQDKELDWHERKERAMEEMKSFSQDALLVKSGDVLSNTTELMSDYARDGAATFERFNAPKEDIVGHTQAVIRLIADLWPDNPLRPDLDTCHNALNDVLEDTRIR